MSYLRASHARKPYTCSECGALISVKEPYFRDEPHPMARIHRGEVVRHLCTTCVTGQPAVEFSEQNDPQQRLFPLSEIVSNLPGLLVHTAIVASDGTLDDRALIQAAAFPWLEIISQVERDPDFLHQLNWRRLEELIAEAYERQGWDDVELTPRSADGGRDIVAVCHAPCSFKVIDQVKAYSPGRRVTANDVRALMGVLYSDLGASKGFVTTTAEFAQGIRRDPGITPLLPYRLELRDGSELRAWLLGIAKQSAHDHGDTPDS